MSGQWGNGWREACIPAVALSTLCWGVLLGCTAPSAGPISPQEATGGDQATTRGGVFLYGARGGAQHLNWYAETGGAASVTLGPIYEPLVGINYQPGKDFREDLKVVPWLAESWQILNETTYEFRLRPNAFWHDGQPLTPADVVFTYEYARDPKNNFRARALFAGVDAIEQPDQGRIRLTAKSPVADLLQNLAEPALVIYPKHVADRGASYEEAGTGSGPFRLERYDRQSGASYVRNERYWREGSPYVDHIRVTWPLDDAALLAAFATGQNDILQIQDKPQLDTAKAVARDLRYSEYVQDSTDAVSLRLDRSPFNDLRVRKALHLAVDRQAMLTVAWHGLGGINPPGVNGARKGWTIPQEELLKLPGYRQPKDQDIAQAKRLLQEAGHGGGLRFTLKYVQTFPRIPQMSQIFAEQLRSIGVQVVLTPMERAAFLKDQREGNFEAYFNPLGRFAPEEDWRNYFHSQGGLNLGRIADPELDRLIEQVETTVGAEQRQKLYVAVQRLLEEKTYVIPTVTPVGFAAWQPWVKDYVFNPLGQAYVRNWSAIKLDLSQIPQNR